MAVVSRNDRIDLLNGHAFRTPHCLTYCASLHTMAYDYLAQSVAVVSELVMGCSAITYRKIAPHIRRLRVSVREVVPKYLQSSKSACNDTYRHLRLTDAATIMRCSIKASSRPTQFFGPALHLRYCLTIAGY